MGDGAQGDVVLRRWQVDGLRAHLDREAQLDREIGALLAAAPFDGERFTELRQERDAEVYRLVGYLAFVLDLADPRSAARPPD